MASNEGGGPSQTKTARAATSRCSNHAPPDLCRDPYQEAPNEKPRKPKATVQAAIGAIPLALGLPNGNLILLVSVLAIVITAPFGAITMDLTYTKLLQHEVDENSSI